MLERALTIAADPDASAEATRLRVFRRLLLVYGAARSWLWVRFLEGPTAVVEPIAILGPAIFLTLCAAASFRPGLERRAARFALPALVLELFVTFPFADNHFFVELLFLILVCQAGSERDDLAVVASLRCLAAIVLFQTGLQKVLYGHYFHGDYLAFMAGTDERFAALLGPVLGAEAMEVLRGFDPLRTGQGPFRVDSALLAIGSNGVYALELALPFFLLARRTRYAAGVVAMALVIGIQLGARELGFALLFVNALALFLPAVWSRRLFATSVVLLATALLLGIVGSPWLAPGFL